MQNRDFRTRITSLYDSQTSPVVVCMHNGMISIMKTGLSWSQTNLSFCACKSAWFAPDLLVSVGPSPHLWFLHAKQRLLDQCTSLYGCQTSPVVLCMQNSVICTRISILHGFQPSSVVLCMQNSDFWMRITNLYGSQTSPVVLCMKYIVISTRITCLSGSQPLSAVFAFKWATFGLE